MDEMPDNKEIIKMWLETGGGNMRDPNRIPVVLKLLQESWEKAPDWRFGQLIENLKRYIGVEDLFYIEDDVLKQHIVDYFELNNEWS